MAVETNAAITRLAEESRLADQKLAAADEKLGQRIDSLVSAIGEMLRAHPGIADALVVGRPSERWGQEVVALVAPHPGADLTADGRALYTFCTSQLAHFKAPKAFIFVEQIQRLGNGKPNYRWAREQAEEKVS